VGGGASVVDLGAGVGSSSCQPGIPQESKAFALGRASSFSSKGCLVVLKPSPDLAAQPARARAKGPGPIWFKFSQVLSQHQSRPNSTLNWKVRMGMVDCFPGLREGANIDLSSVKPVVSPGASSRSLQVSWQRLEGESRSLEGGCL
jgi:hypothetical protein